MNLSIFLNFGIARTNYEKFKLGRKNVVCIRLLPIYAYYLSTYSESNLFPLHHVKLDLCDPGDFSRDDVTVLDRTNSRRGPGQNEVAGLKSEIPGIQMDVISVSAIIS